VDVVVIDRVAQELLLPEAVGRAGVVVDVSVPHEEARKRALVDFERSYLAAQH
jgi:hypothetical protein